MTETEELTRLRELAKGFAQELNRRVAVEQLMLDAARGKRAMPTPEELRAWAMRLGVPEQTPEMVTSTFVGSPLEIQSRVTMNPKLERAMVLKSIPMLEIAEFVADDEAMIGLVQCAIEDKRVPFAYDCCWPPDGDGRPYTEMSTCTQRSVERFAALVAEQCASVCSSEALDQDMQDRTFHEGCMQCTQRIRAAFPKPA